MDKVDFQTDAKAYRTQEWWTSKGRWNGGGPYAITTFGDVDELSSQSVAANRLGDAFAAPYSPKEVLQPGTLVVLHVHAVEMVD